MKKLLMSLNTTVLLVLMAFTQANASVIVDPTTGRSGGFGWTNSIVDTIDGTANIDFSITVASNSVIDVTLDDCCAIGDEFSLWLDGLLLTPTASNPGAGILYFANYFNIFLSSGSHILAITLSTAAPGFTTGGADYGISAARAVPEPAPLALLGFGLLGLAAMRKRRA